jgi:hypothetical protein
MAFNIGDIRGALKGGGTRPSLFQVTITNKVNTIADSITPFLVNATTIPASNLSNIPIPYFGRYIKVAGTRTFSPWTVTVMNDEDFLIRNAMEQWTNTINGLTSNLNGFGTPSPNDYKSQATVIQYGKNGDILREYSFSGIFPTSVSDMALDWSQGNSIQQFNVTFEYDYYNVTGGSTGTASPGGTGLAVFPSNV